MNSYKCKCKFVLFFHNYLNFKLIKTLIKEKYFAVLKNFYNFAD